MIIVSMELTEQLQMLDNEIAWCHAHPDNDLSVDFQLGFVRGLEQAKFLLLHKTVDFARSPGDTWHREADGET
jgi:hypothetical protein